MVLREKRFKEIKKYRTAFYEEMKRYFRSLFVSQLNVFYDYLCYRLIKLLFELCTAQIAKANVNKMPKRNPRLSLTQIKNALILILVTI